MFEKIQKFITNFFKNKRNILCLIIVLILGIFVFGDSVHAIGLIGKSIAIVVGHLVEIIIRILGLVLGMLMFLLVRIATYNEFVNTPAVENGWEIVRDLCNMFFILILLVIAFATILRVETYNIKKLLPKLIIMAILINFSKMICGVIIDFSQVIMLTFVNSFKEIGGNKLIEILGIEKLLQFSTAEEGFTESVTTLRDIVGSYILALIFILISIVVITIMVAVLAMRMVMLWIYIVLSPLAYLLAAFPQGQRYAADWWKRFSETVIVGPILAFFIWLAFSSLGNVTNRDRIVAEFGSLTNAPTGVTEAASVEHMIKFVIAIGMLMGGLMITQTLAGGVGAVAGKGIEAIQKGRKGFFKTTGRVAGYLPRQMGKKMGYEIGDKALGVAGKMPLVGGFAMEGRDRLRMKREYAEEKDTRYMKYRSDSELDRTMQLYTGKGRKLPFLSGVGRLKEDTRKAYKGAILQKATRGNFSKGKEGEEMKTRMALDMMKLGEASVTAEGDLSWRDADMEKAYKDFTKKNLTQIDPQTLYEGHLEQFAGKVNDDKDSAKPDTKSDRENFIAKYENSNNFVEEGAKDMSAKDLREMHPSQLKDGRILDSFWNRGKKKAIAQVYDLESGKKRDIVHEWAGSRGLDVGTDRDPDNAKKDGGGDLGKPRKRMDRANAKSLDIKSGITGLDTGGIEKGRLAASFSKLGLEGDAKYLQGKDKDAVAGRIGNSLRNSGVSDTVAKSIEDGIKQVSFLKLFNKDVAGDRSLSDTKESMAHEAIHGRTASLTNEEKDQVWSSMSPENQENARSKVKKQWGDVDDDVVKDEYIVQGLTNKTRWAEKDSENKITLDPKAEATLGEILASKGSNIENVTSNLTADRPTVTGITDDDIKETVVSSSGTDNKEVAKAIEKLTDQMMELGDSFGAIKEIGTSIEDLGSSMKRNDITLQKLASANWRTTKGLKKLSNKID